VISIEAKSHSVAVSAGARDAISNAALISRDGRETGGILLGRDPGEKGEIEVVRAAGPGPRAIRRPSYFLRDLNYSRRLARLAYERDRLQWVGDWHTHPHGPDIPSVFDLLTYARHLDDVELKFEAFVAVIVTPNSRFDWGKCRLNSFVYSAPQ
jgi:integrative and conjugative element protein (TIGR02256 family)